MSPLLTPQMQQVPNDITQTVQSCEKLLFISFKSAVVHSHWHSMALQRLIQYLTTW